MTKWQVATHNAKVSSGNTSTSSRCGRWRFGISCSGFHPGVATPVGVIIYHFSSGDSFWKNSHNYFYITYGWVQLTKFIVQVIIISDGLLKFK